MAASKVGTIVATCKKSKTALHQVRIESQTAGLGGYFPYIVIKQFTHLLKTLPLVASRAYIFSMCDCPIPKFILLSP